MKRIALTAFAFATIGMAMAQVTTPQPSTGSKMEQTVGLTDVSVKYSRPSVNDRVIFGNLVPFDKMWRTGANMNTVVSFGDDVIINGKELKAGDYALYTKPSEKSWEVYFYSEVKNWGLPRKWDDANVALTTTVESNETAIKSELFTILINSNTDNSGEIILHWDKTSVSIAFDVPTDKKAMASIKSTLAGEEVKAGDYFSSAIYYLTSNKDINKAKEWIDKAVEMTNESPRYWFLYQQALITAKAGDVKTAKKIAQMSMDLAEKSGDNSYVLKNKASLKKWK